MNKTGIEYLTHSWNPLAMRCTPISEGCSHCWHLKRADMLGKNDNIPGYYQKAYRGEIGPVLIEERLKIPNGKPKIIGVQFMGDLFHDDVTNEMIDTIFSIITEDITYPLHGLFQKPRHTCLILTKRPERILKGHPGYFARWPNIWLGVTVENDKHRDRIDILRSIPAAVRFISFEPLLSAVENLDLTGISWCIAGCESGPGRRPSKYEWFRDLKNQCVDAGTPFFLKQANRGYGQGIVKLPRLDGRIWDQMPGSQGEG